MPALRAPALAVAIACRLIAREIVGFIYGLDGNGGGALEWVASRFREDADMTSFIPSSFNVPDGLKGKITTAVIKTMPERVGSRCPAYDLILQYVYDMAGLAMQEFVKSGDEEGVKRMREVQVVAAFLGNDAVRPWYYKNVDRAIAKVVSRLAGGCDGKPGAGDNDNEAPRG